MESNLTGGAVRAEYHGKGSGTDLDRSKHSYTCGSHEHTVLVCAHGAQKKSSRGGKVPMKCFACGYGGNFSF